MPGNETTRGVPKSLFGRSGDLYQGAPPEGFLQRFHPAARLTGAVMLLLGVSLADNPLALLGVFSVIMLVAVFSYLNMKSVYRVLLIPVLLLALPAWLVAALINGAMETGALFFLRTLVSLSVAGVAIHSVGLRHVSEVLEFLKVPMELRQMWTIMVAQVANFMGLVSDMTMARTARRAVGSSGRETRREVGRQAGVLFSRTWQRGNELAFAMEARAIGNGQETSPRGRAFTVKDYAFLLVCGMLVVGLVSA